METLIVPPKKFNREATKATMPDAKPREEGVFQWMLFKPQAHAVAPFPANENARDANKTRTQGK